MYCTIDEDVYLPSRAETSMISGRAVDLFTAEASADVYANFTGIFARATGSALIDI